MESQREGNHTTKPLHAESWAVNNSWHRAARASATLQLALNYIIKRRGMFSSGLTRKQEEDRVGRGGWNCRPSVKIFLTITLLHLYWLSDKLLQFEKIGGWARWLCLRWRKTWSAEEVLSAKSNPIINALKSFLCCWISGLKYEGINNCLEQKLKELVRTNLTLQTLNWGLCIIKLQKIHIINSTM